MRVEIYDLECLKNLFTYTGLNYHTKEIYQFVICEWRNDFDELCEHLNISHLLQVGFNNENPESDYISDIEADRRREDKSPYNAIRFIYTVPGLKYYPDLITY